eukprot:1153245-Pelagomonas_calceolata.AAC.10
MSVAGSEGLVCNCRELHIPCSDEAQSIVFGVLWVWLWYSSALVVAGVAQPWGLSVTNGSGNPDEAAQAEGVGGLPTLFAIPHTQRRNIPMLHWLWAKVILECMSKGCQYMSTANVNQGEDAAHFCHGCV